jgi:hypothetical protein
VLPVPETAYCGGVSRRRLTAPEVAFRIACDRLFAAAIALDQVRPHQGADAVHDLGDDETIRHRALTSEVGTDVI